MLPGALLDLPISDEAGCGCWGTAEQGTQGEDRIWDRRVSWSEMRQGLGRGCGVELTTSNSALQLLASSWALASGGHGAGTGVAPVLAVTH